MSRSWWASDIAIMLCILVTFVSAALLCLYAKGMRGQTGAHVQGALEGQTTAHEQRASQARQLAVCKGHQRADECLHVKGIRRQTSACMQRGSQGRQVAVYKRHQRADKRLTRWLTAFMKRACSSEVHTKRGFLAPLLSPCLSELSSPLPSLQQHNNNSSNNNNNNNNLEAFQLIVLARYSNIMYVTN